MKDSSLSIRSSYHEFILSKPNQARRVHSLLENGRRLLEAGHNNEARRFFLQALSIYPLVIPALNNLALIALREGDVNRAIDVIEEVLTCDPRDPIAHGLAVQCWYFRESEPLVRAHADACLAGYMQVIEEGDPVDPDYSNRAFPFVFQALLIAEHDSGLIALYEAVPDRSWTEHELTWIGIANFNRGRLSEAHRLWRLAAKASRFEPALIYASLVQHVLSEDILPFTLDYELIWPDGDTYGPYNPSTLAIAAMVNDIFRLPSAEAQELIGQLVETNMPAQEYFLRRLVQNRQLGPGVRMAAAVQLLWLEDDLSFVDDLWHGVNKDELSSDDLPVYYLLGAMVTELHEDINSESVYRLVEEGRKVAQEGCPSWIAQALDDFFADDDPWIPHEYGFHIFADLLTSHDPDAPFFAAPEEENAPEPHDEEGPGSTGRKKGRGDSRRRKH